MAVEDVQETLFFPLMGRAEAARRWPEVFSDPWAHEVEEIMRAEGTTAVSLGNQPAAVYGLRHLITLTEIRRYLRSHPGAAVVNIGCGLDRIAPELEDVLTGPTTAGSAPTRHSTVYNLDYPEVLEMRSRWVRDSPLEVDLPYSATDHGWMDHVDGSKGMIAIAAGVFYYLEVEEVSALVAAMAARFPGGRLAYDSESPFVIRMSERSVRKGGIEGAPMPFKIGDPYAARGWSDRVSRVHVEFDFSRYLPPSRRRALPRWTRAGFSAFRLVRGMYEVVVDFAGDPA